MKKAIYTIKFLLSKYAFCIHLLSLVMALWNECESVINGKSKSIFNSFITVSFLTGSLFLDYFFVCGCMVTMYISQSLFQARIYILFLTYEKSKAIWK